MIRHALRSHPAYLAFLGHRLSGIGLALFLPAHFLALGTALESDAALDRFLAFTAHPLVKLAEWGLVVLLTAHLAFGIRLMAIELAPRRGLSQRWIGLAMCLALVVGLLFALSLLA